MPRFMFSLYPLFAAVLAHCCLSLSYCHIPSSSNYCFQGGPTHCLCMSLFDLWQRSVFGTSEDQVPLTFCEQQDTRFVPKSDGSLKPGELGSPYIDSPGMWVSVGTAQWPRPGAMPSGSTATARNGFTSVK